MPRRSSRRSPKPTTFSAIPRSARFTTSSGFTPTTSIQRRLKPMHALAAGRRRASGGFPGGFPGGQPARAARASNFDFGGFDFSDLFEGGGREPQEPAAGGSFRDIFSGMFGGRGGAAQPKGPSPGTDLEYQVNVPFWTAIRGGVMRLNITRRDVCTNCHGKGYIESPGKCPQCGGTGQVTQTGGRMKFNVTCPRCHGTGKNITTCPHLPRRRHGRAD